MNDWLAILWGALQGITEFLPISSSGHLFLLQSATSFQKDSLFFIVILHGATILSIFTVFFKDLQQTFTPLKSATTKKLLLNLTISTVPLVFVGLFFKSFIEQAFKQPVVAIGFLSTGALLLFLAFRQKKYFQSSLKLHELSLLQAFVLGLFQVLALLPGFSRSGWTISAGLFLGLRPQDAVYYSFLMALPAVAGACVLEIFEKVSNGFWQGFTFSVLLGFVTAYLVGVLALYWTLKLVQKERFFLFGFYLIPLGFYLLLFGIKVN